MPLLRWNAALLGFLDMQLILTGLGHGTTQQKLAKHSKKLAGKRGLNEPGDSSAACKLVQRTFQQNFNKKSTGRQSKCNKGWIKMTRQWKQLSLEDAKRHPLYGIKNWLAVYGFLLLIGPLVTIGQFSNSAHQSGLTLPQLLSADIAAGAFIKATIAFNVAIAALSFWFLFSKHQHFRVGSIALLVLQWPAYLVVLFIIGDPKIPGLAAELTIRFLSSLLWIVVWVTYLQRSRRVRVTFENCVVVESSQASAIHEYRMPFSKTLPMTSDNDVYAAALAEIEEQRVNKGTWARSFAESDGDESKAKATYIKLRVAALTEQATRKEAVSIGSEPTQEKTENSYLIDVASTRVLMNMMSTT